ncbi:hypothetical protein GGI20_001315 [Coemansia sp. BCRC 34301]|nr:hypothetical protein GGI20_001315 [Coemansia sp. BCRC 34301]
MRAIFGAERPLALFGSRFQPIQARGFSYTTLVDPDFVDGFQTYQADDQAFSSLSRPVNNGHSQIHGHGSGGGSQALDGQRRRHASAGDDSWSSITAQGSKQGVNVFDTYTDFCMVESEDIPRIDGKARQLRHRARRKIASAFERARTGWETLLFGLSQVKCRGGGVPGPCFY